MIWNIKKRLFRWKNLQILGGHDINPLNEGKYTNKTSTNTYLLF